MKQIELKVLESISGDEGKGIMRIDLPFLHEIGAKDGDILAVEGRRKTFAIARMAYLGDAGLKLVRMDGIIRRNSNVGAGETVKIYKANLKLAKKVVVCPANSNVVLSVEPEVIMQPIIGRPFAQGDIFSISKEQGRDISKFFNDVFIFEIFKSRDDGVKDLSLSNVKLKVLRTYPNKEIVIDKGTELIVKKGKKELFKSRFVEYTESYMEPFEKKLNLINNIQELEKLRDKVNSTKVRISPNVIKNLNNFKFNLMRRIDKKVSNLRKKKKK